MSDTSQKSSPPSKSNTSGETRASLPKNESPNVLHDKKGLRYHLILETVRQGAELLGSILVKVPGCGISGENVADVLNQHGVTVGIDHEAIATACERANAGHRVERVRLAWGVPPRHGEDEHVVFLAQPSMDHRPSDDSEEDVDYHHQHLFENVIEGQIIAKTIPPTNGVAGKSVTGEDIHAENGHQLEQPLCAGDNVRTLDGGKTFEAMKSGRVIHDKTMNMISVTDHYLIDGDVGYATGDVDFVGSVEIKGEVTKSFNVKAGKWIKIDGNVESCHLEAKGDVVISGGVSGQESGTIRCGGVLTAKYLDAVDVECAQSIIVKNEIVKCAIRCAKTIQVTSGAIIGGECVAFKGVEAMEIGSSSGAKTVVVVGKSYLAERNLAEITARLEELDDFERQLNERIDPLRNDPEAFNAASKKDQAHIKALVRTLKRVIEERDALKPCVTKIRRQTRDAANMIVNVKKKIHNNVHLKMGDHLNEIKESRTSPATIIKNSRDGTLSFTQLHALKTSARLIECELLKKEGLTETKAREIAGV